MIVERTKILYELRDKIGREKHTDLVVIGARMGEKMWETANAFDKVS